MTPTVLFYELPDDDDVMEVGEVSVVPAIGDAFWHNETEFVVEARSFAVVHSRVDVRRVQRLDVVVTLAPKR